MNSPNPTAPLMQMAQQTLSNPVASAVPAPQGGIDAGVHPVVAGLVKLLANAASSYGWTSMPPQQRLEAQGQEQQKAETMARLAQTGAYQEGELGVRESLAKTAAQNATTRGGELARKQSWDEFKQGMMKQQEQDKVEHNKALEALGQGRIDEASRRNDAYLESVKNRYQVAEQNVGLGYGKLAVQQDLANILRYRSQLEAISTQQRGTDMGIKATAELAKMESDHWLQNLLGMGGTSTLQQSVGQAVPLPGAAQPGGAGMPGVGAGGQPPTVGATPATAPPANPKAAAKNRQKNPQAAVQQFHYDAQGNRVAGPQ